MVHTTEFQLVRLFFFSMLLIGLNHHVRVIYSTMILLVILHCFISDDKFYMISVYSHRCVPHDLHVTWQKAKQDDLHVNGRKQNKMTHVTWQKAEQDDICHMAESKSKMAHMLHGRKQSKRMLCYMAKSKTGRHACYMVKSCI